MRACGLRRNNMLRSLQGAWAMILPDPIRGRSIPRGCLVLDKSSAFRMASEVPLVLPEINLDAARAHRGSTAVVNR